MLYPLVVAAIAVWIAIASLGDSDRKHAQDLRDYVATNFAVTQNIHVRVADLGLRFPDLVNATQAQLDHRLRTHQIPFRYELVDELPTKIKKTRNPLWEPAEIVLTVDSTEYILQDETQTMTESSPTESAENGSDAQDIHVEEEIVSEQSPSRTPPQYVVELAYTDKLGIWVDLYEQKATLTYSLESVFTNDLPFYLTQAIYDNLLSAELEQLAAVNYGQFDHYHPRLNVNFVAAEELGATPQELQSEIDGHMKYLASQIDPYVQLSYEFLTVDITKQKIPREYLANSTSTLNFVYLTSLAGIINNVQGIELYHISENLIELDENDQQNGLASGHNSTAFMEEYAEVIKDAVSLPKSDTGNLNLLVESSMKHSAISGIVAVLDALLQAEKFDRAKFGEVVELVDNILSEKEHDWSVWLKQVYGLYTS